MLEAVALEDRPMLQEVLDDLCDVPRIVQTAVLPSLKGHVERFEHTTDRGRAALVCGRKRLANIYDTVPVRVHLLEWDSELLALGLKEIEDITPPIRDERNRLVLLDPLPKPAVESHERASQ